VLALGASIAPCTTEISMTAAGTPEETPQARPKRTGLMAALIGGGALVLALIAAGAVWGSIETASHTPQAAVKPYLDALVKGDVAKAVKAGNIDTRSPLVTQKVYSKTADRVTGYSIRPGSAAGNEATVTVRYVQGANRNTEVLHLKKIGTDMLFFTRWALEPVALPAVKIAVGGPTADGVTVNESAVRVGDDGVTELQALPGRYEVSVAATASVTGDDQSATITRLQASSNAPADTATLTVRFTDAGQQAANAAVNAWVAGCIAQPTIQPEGCSFGLTDDYPDLHLSNQRWTLASAPTFEIGPWDGRGWPVVTSAAGAATFLADFSGDDGSYGTLYSQSAVPVQVEGEITGFDKSGAATFQSIDWSGKAAQATA
jgi:hypothetical protein